MSTGMLSEEEVPGHALFLFGLALLLFYTSVLLGTWLATPLSIFTLVMIHYGSHEAVHGALFRRTQLPELTRVANFLCGVLGAATIGQNFLFMRWDHQAHHSRTRALHCNSIDGKFIAPGTRGYVRYYFELFGAELVLNELLGYVYAAHPSLQLKRARQFPIRKIGVATFRWIQGIVFLTTVILLVLGGWKFITARLIFVLYWGLAQNVAHYGMTVDPSPHEFIAARTYRLHPWISTLFFGSFHRHIEHHAFPRISGLRLAEPVFAQRLQERWKIQPVVRGGLRAYLLDLVCQFRGPHYREAVSAWCQSVE